MVTCGDIQHLGLHPSLLLINESDVYRLVMRSNLPSAEKFQDWVFEVVLPCIRQMGDFIPDFTKPADAAKAFLEQHNRAELAIATKAEIGSRREATSMNTASQATKKVARLEHQLKIANNYYTIKQMSRLYPKLAKTFDIEVLSHMCSKVHHSVTVCNTKGLQLTAFHRVIWHHAYNVECEDTFIEV